MSTIFVEEGKMEIRRDNKFFTFFKRFGLYILGGFIIVAVIVTATVAGVLANRGGEQEPVVNVTTEPISFGLPMNDAVIIRDYSDELLQYNETMAKYQSHCAVDLTSEDPTVMAVADGTVVDVDYRYLYGNIVTIEHKDGFVSVYSSLDSNLEVSEGDSVVKGQKIGTISTSAANEATYGAHLELTLYQNDEKVDPNSFISLQSK